MIDFSHRQVFITERRWGWLMGRLLEISKSEFGFRMKVDRPAAFRKGKEVDAINYLLIPTTGFGLADYEFSDENHNPLDAEELFGVKPSQRDGNLWKGTLSLPKDI